MPIDSSAKKRNKIHQQQKFDDGTVTKVVLGKK